MKLVFLGTSGAMPTAKRGLSSTVLSLDKEYIMVDCGEGTARQYLQSTLKWNKPLTILITHLHSDHVMGLFGLLQSMDLMKRTERVDIYGVKGLNELVGAVRNAVSFKFGYDFTVKELDEGDVVKGNEFTITCCRSKHRIANSLAYKVQLPDKAGELDVDKAVSLGAKPNSPELGMLKRGINIIVDQFNNIEIKAKDVVGEPQKGFSVAFSGDTRPTHALLEFYKGVDYLVHESTFRNDEQELAIQAQHSTAEEAGTMAKDACVKHVFLNHFSARHATTEGFYEDATKHFPYVTITKDLLEVELI